MEEMTVTQVAERLGKTDRTVRNYIKEGRLKAKRVENQFGWEYRVYDLGEFARSENNAEEKTGIPSETLPEKKTETALQIVSQENQRLWEENRQLREINNRLAYDLGGRDQRIKELEQELAKVQAILPASAPNTASNNQGAIEAQKAVLKPWWKRLLRI